MKFSKFNNILEIQIKQIFQNSIKHNKILEFQNETEFSKFKLNENFEILIV